MEQKRKENNRSDTEPGIEVLRGHDGVRGQYYLQGKLVKRVQRQLTQG